MENIGQSNGRGNARTAFLGAICMVAMVMLWWMYSEQIKIQQLTSMRSGVSDVDITRENIKVIIQQPPNVTNIIVNERQKDEKWDYNWDRRQWAEPDEAQGVGVRTLVLVRHGKYDYNTGLLTPMGKQQANLTGVRLKEMGIKFDRIYHSTLDRARETAEIIHKHLPDIVMEADYMLQEGGPIPPTPTISYWGLPETQYFVEGPRMESAFRKHVHRADKSQTAQTHELLVGHGNIFRYFALRALQLESSAWMRVFIAHASITILHVNPDSTVTMTRFGDSGHFPPDLVTF